MAATEKLSRYFGMSYAIFAILPRIMMSDMPDEWQDKMYDLLNEFDNTYPNFPELDFHVTSKNDADGKFASIPDWILNYRYPDRDKIKECKGVKDE